MPFITATLTLDSSDCDFKKWLMLKLILVLIQSSLKPLNHAAVITHWLTELEPDFVNYDETESTRSR